jgi:hypothetical protein
VCIRLERQWDHGRQGPSTTYAASVVTSATLEETADGEHHHHHRWQNKPFPAIAVLRRFCQICLFQCICRELHHPVFTSLDFATIFLFTKQGHQHCVQPPTWRTRSRYLCPPMIGGPRHRVLSSSPSTTHRGLRWGYSNPPPHPYPQIKRPRQRNK